MNKWRVKSISSVFDSWKGRRGFNRRALKKKMNKTEQDTVGESEQINDGAIKS